MRQIGYDEQEEESNERKVNSRQDADNHRFRYIVPNEGSNADDMERGRESDESITRIRIAGLRRCEVSGTGEGELDDRQ